MISFHHQSNGLLSVLFASMQNSAPINSLYIIRFMDLDLGIQELITILQLFWLMAD